MWWLCLVGAMDHAVFYGDGQTWSSMGVGYFSYCDIYPNSTVSCQPWSTASLWRRRLDGCPSMQQRRSGICWSFQPIQTVFFDATTWWWLSWWWSPLGFHIFQKWLKSIFTICWSMFPFSFLNVPRLLVKSWFVALQIPCFWLVKSFYIIIIFEYSMHISVVLVSICW